MHGKWVCQEIKNNVLNQLQGIEALKSELQRLTALGILELWKADDSPVLKLEFSENIQKDSKKIDDVEALLSSFDEVNLLKKIYSWTKVEVIL